MAEEDKGQGGPNKGNAGSTELIINVDGEQKTLTAEEAVAMIKERAAITQQGQKAASILKTAEKYGIDPEEFVAQSEGAFDKLAELIEQGILDKEGNVVSGKFRTTPPGGQPKASDSDPPARWSQRDPSPSEEKFMSIVQKALEPFAQRMDTLEQDQARMIRLDVEGRLKSEHPDLDDEDIARLFVRSKRDRSKTIWAHAKEMAEGKRSMREKMKEDLARELGVDLKEWQERNKLKDQDARAISAGIVEGKKPSFKKGEGRISPAKATEELFRRTFSRGG